MVTQPPVALPRHCLRYDCLPRRKELFETNALRLRSATFFRRSTEFELLKMVVEADARDYVGYMRAHGNRERPCSKCVRDRA